MTCEEDIIALDPHLSHIEAMVLGAHKESLDKVLETYDAPDPILEHLPVSVFQNSRGELGHFDVPPHFLAGQAPRLRVLNLWDCLPTWSNLSPFKSLVRLSINGLRVIRDPPPVTEYIELFKFLQQMSNFEILDLCYLFPPRPEFLTTKFVVQLPRLPRLVLTGYPSDCLALLQCLDLPRAAELHLFVTFHDRVGLEDGWTDLIFIATSHFTAAPSSNSPSRYLILNSRVDSVLFSILLELHHGIVSQTPLQPQVPVGVISFVWMNGLARAAESSIIISQVLHELPLAGLPVVSVSVEAMNWSATNWLETFAQYNAVQHVRAESYAGVALVNALTESTAAGWPVSGATPQTVQDGPHGDSHFPQLISLSLPKKVVFCSSHPSLTGKNSLRVALGTVFVTWLQRRIARQASLKRLSLHDCNLWQSQEDSLRQLVPAFEYVLEGRHR
ncbi:hypothetical protein BV25DRAFT_1913962 [Artomyces pyxidatus]|uniref:Uncharacterized protein n=1 Tax=Artomyces pyxidatus TaxID=48021 RepID=A0ACB8T7M1_9AGAM|nr:hypothetical protein BV25DRAFT_1913962 [Artomyces pyxidatus]